MKFVYMLKESIKPVHPRKPSEISTHLLLPISVKVATYVISGARKTL